jgi:hypothetical protein
MTEEGQLGDSRLETEKQPRSLWPGIRTWRRPLKHITVLLSQQYLLAALRQLQLFTTREFHKLILKTWAELFANCVCVFVSNSLPPNSTNLQTICLPEHRTVEWFLLDKQNRNQLDFISLCKPRLIDVPWFVQPKHTITTTNWSLLVGSPMFGWSRESTCYRWYSCCLAWLVLYFLKCLAITSMDYLEILLWHGWE